MKASENPAHQDERSSGTSRRSRTWPSTGWWSPSISTSAGSASSRKSPCACSSTSWMAALIGLRCDHPFRKLQGEEVHCLHPSAVGVWVTTGRGKERMFKVSSTMFGWSARAQERDGTASEPHLKRNGWYTLAEFESLKKEATERDRENQAAFGGMRNPQQLPGKGSWGTDIPSSSTGHRPLSRSSSAPSMENYSVRTLRLSSRSVASAT